MGVMPENRPELVEAVMERLCGVVIPHKVVKLQILNQKTTSQGIKLGGISLGKIYQKVYIVGVCGST